jgi:hypothetical protein
MSIRKTRSILSRMLSVLCRNNSTVHIRLDWLQGFGSITDSERGYGFHSGKDFVSFV